MRIVEVFADVACPFTHVGLRRFVERRSELDRDDVVLRVRSWPLEVVNGEPLDPGVIADEVGELMEQVAPDLFVGFSATSFPATSIPALSLAMAADAVDVRVGERVSLLLRTLLFEDGVDIADEDVLRSVAQGHGVPWDEVDGTRVEADHAEGVRRDVVGSPHFFTPEGDFFCPALEIARDESGHLRIEQRTEAFQLFLSACFG